eukprot:7257866-Pyramimonas_sp.AAC.1
MPPFLRQRIPWLPFWETGTSVRWRMAGLLSQGRLRLGTVCNVMLFRNIVATGVSYTNQTRPEGIL